MTYVKRRLWYDAPTSEREKLDEDDLLSRSEPLVILGEPGMGKSKLLQIWPRRQLCHGVRPGD